MIRFDEILRRLSEGGVEFVIVGGVAAVAQGYEGSTFDFDICARFSPENLDRLLRAFRDVGVRFAPPSERPITESGLDLSTYRFLALSTGIGRIDVLKEVAPIGMFDDAAKISDQISLFGQKCLVLSLDGIIAIKEHVARDKDLRSLTSLRALKALRKQSE